MTTITELTTQARTCYTSAAHTLAYAMADPDTDRARATLAGGYQVCDRITRRITLASGEATGDHCDRDLEDAVRRLYAITRTLHDLSTSI